MKDPHLRELTLYLQREELPSDPEKARKLVVKASQLILHDGILFYLDQERRGTPRVAVPTHLREELMHDSHRGVYSGHPAGLKLYKTLSQMWWWAGMYSDVLSYCRNCPECAVVTGAGRQHRPPLRPIPIQRPFQKIGADIMDLSCTERGNKHVVVFQDISRNGLWCLLFLTSVQSVS